MRAALAALALGLVLAVTGLPGQKQEARAQVSFGFHSGGYYGGPSFGIHVGRRHYGHRRYYRSHRPWRYRRHYYGGYNYRPYVYRPYYYSRRYYTPRPPRAGRCGHWASRCAANWGSGGANFRGCLRYHGC